MWLINPGGSNVACRISGNMLSLVTQTPMSHVVPKTITGAPNGKGLKSMHPIGIHTHYHVPYITALQLVALVKKCRAIRMIQPFCA